MSIQFWTGQALWIAPALMQLALAMLRRRRRLERDFPLFFVYLLSQLVRFAVLYFIGNLPGRHYALYFYTYWTANAVDSVFVFGVVNEIYAHVLRPYEALRGLNETIFRWSFAVMLLVSVLVAASSGGENEAWVVRGVLMFDQSTAVVIGGVLFLLFLFSSYLGLKWRDFVFGIALGLALFTIVEVTAIAIRIRWGMVAANSLALVSSAAYNCSVLIWVIYCLRRQEARAPVETLPQNNLARWNEALLAMVHR